MTEVLSRNFVLGKKLGYFLGYAVFSSMLYFVLSLLGKLPSSITPLSFSMLTFAVVVLGIIIERTLR